MYMRKKETTLEKKVEKSNDVKLRKWSDRLYIAFMFVLVFVGLGLMFHQSIANYFVNQRSMSYVNDTKPSDMVANENADVSFDAANVGSVTSADVLLQMTSGANHNTNLPVVGAIAIPDLGMNLPIMKGLDNTSLSVGAGTMKPDQKMGVGNYALASHSLFYGMGHEKLLFTPLRLYAKTGQTIYMRDSENIYVYYISDIFIVNPEDGYVISDMEGEGILTLVTCTDAEARQRTIVRGQLERQFPIKDAWPELREYFGSEWTRWW